MRDYEVVEFIYPLGMDYPEKTIATFEPGNVTPPYEDLSLSEFLGMMEADQGYELVTIIPIRIDPVGVTRLNLIFRTLEDWHLDTPEEIEAYNREHGQAHNPVETEE